jgi:hypothetical protein
MSDVFQQEAEAFLRENGIDPAAGLERLAGGANNQVHRIRGERDVVLKRYFQREGDHRDRFAAERYFYEAAWAGGVKRIPEPIAWSRDSRLGLFAHVDGRTLEPGEVGLEQVEQAVALVVEVNSRAAEERLESAPVAAEACMHVEEYRECVERRLARLESVSPATDIELEASAFVRGQLRPAWKEIDALMREEVDHRYSDAWTGLPLSEQCLSPSDFGFHNALLQPDGELRFFDFEYAGMDDPAKLVCDFFCQPAIPAPLEHWDLFVDGLQELRRWDDCFPARARWALPACRIKWVCIMLNEFVRSEMARREFSLTPDEMAERQEAQLAKAKKALEEIAG